MSTRCLTQHPRSRCCTRWFLNAFQARAESFSTTSSSTKRAMRTGRAVDQQQPKQLPWSFSMVTSIEVYCISQFISRTFLIICSSDSGGEFKPTLRLLKVRWIKRILRLGIEPGTLRFAVRALTVPINAHFSMLDDVTVCPVIQGCEHPDDHICL